MKKLLCAAIAVVMLLSLAGCKKDEDVLIPAPDVIEQTDETKTEVQDEENGRNEATEEQNGEESDIFVFPDKPDLPREIQTEYYTLTPMLIEDVADDEHNRKIRLYQLDTDSACKDAINEMIFDSPSEKLDEYMDCAPVFFQNLLLDTTFTDDGEVLSIAVLGKQTMTYVSPLISQFVYWDYKNDTLLTLKEYAEKAEISLDTVGQRASEYVDSLGNGTYGSRFDYTIDGMFHWEDDVIFVITVCPREEYKDEIFGSFSEFYSYKKDAFFVDDMFDDGFYRFLLFL